MVVDGIDLSVDAGELVALLGHNGSGKSTLMRAAFDLVPLRSGSIALRGVQSRRAEARPHALLLAGNEQLPTFLSGRELIQLLATMYAVQVDEPRIDELFALYGMAGRQDDLIEDYSHGMRKKTQLVAALLLRRPLTVVDETLNGIDREALVLAEEDLAGLTDGGAVILCSHELPMLERVATRVVVLDGGRIVADLPMSHVLDGDGGLAGVLDEHALDR
ncbi:ABC transporter ATP-binding protein [Agrococcus versicolor]